MNNCFCNSAVVAKLLQRFFKFTEPTNYILTFSFDFAEQYVDVDIFIKDLSTNREAITFVGYQQTRFMFSKKQALVLG